MQRSPHSLGRLPASPLPQGQCWPGSFSPTPVPAGDPAWKPSCVSRASACGLCGRSSPGPSHLLLLRRRQPVSPPGTGPFCPVVSSEVRPCALRSSTHWGSGGVDSERASPRKQPVGRSDAQPRGLPRPGPGVLPCMHLAPEHQRGRRKGRGSPPRPGGIESELSCWPWARASGKGNCPKHASLVLARPPWPRGQRGTRGRMPCRSLSSDSRGQDREGLQAPQGTTPAHGARPVRWLRGPGDRGGEKHVPALRHGSVHSHARWRLSAGRALAAPPPTQNCAFVSHSTGGGLGRRSHGSLAPFLNIFSLRSDHAKAAVESRRGRRQVPVLGWFRALGAGTESQSFLVETDCGKRGTF